MWIVWHLGWSWSGVQHAHKHHNTDECDFQVNHNEKEQEANASGINRTANTSYFTGICTILYIYIYSFCCHGQVMDIIINLNAHFRPHKYDATLTGLATAYTSRQSSWGRNFLLAAHLLAMHSFFCAWQIPIRALELEYTAATWSWVYRSFGSAELFCHHLGL